jgi:hypothetical protein
MAAVSGLAGCGARNSPAGGGGSPASGGTSPATQAKKATASCALAPASLVNSTLGTNVGAPAAQELGAIAVCRYSPAAGASGSVVVRIQTDMGAELFAKSRQTSDANGLATTDIAGFQDKAYSSVLKVGSHVTNTVVALKGTIEILVSSPATFEQEMALESQLFAQLV